MTASVGLHAHSPKLDSRGPSGWTFRRGEAGETRESKSGERQGSVRRASHARPPGHGGPSQQPALCAVRNASSPRAAPRPPVLCPRRGRGTSPGLGVPSLSARTARVSWGLRRAGAGPQGRAGKGGGRVATGLSKPLGVPREGGHRAVGTKGAEQADITSGTTTDPTGWVSHKI